MKINALSTLIKVEDLYNRIYVIIDSCKTVAQLDNVITWAYDITSYETLAKRYKLDRVYKFGSVEYEYFDRHLDKYKNILYKKIKNKAEEIKKISNSESNKAIENAVKNFIDSCKNSSNFQKDNIIHEFLNTDNYNTIKEGLNSCSNSVIMEFIFACMSKNNTKGIKMY